MYNVVKMENKFIKKHHLLLLTVLFISGKVFSQDKLVSLKNDSLNVKVIEITPKEIKYKSSDNPDGPLITVNKNEYVSILFANGTSQVLQDAKAIKKRIVYKNSINFDFMSFLTNEVEINYERLLKGNMIGIQVPLRFGYKNNNLVPYTGYNNNNYDYYYGYNNYQNNNLDFSFSTGTFIKFYYNKPAIVRGYSGIELIGAVLKSSTNFSYYDSNTGNTINLGTFKDYQGVLGFMALTGFKVTPYPRVTFSLDGGGGYGGIFSKVTKRTINGVDYTTNQKRTGTGLWKVSTSIGINF